MSDGSSAVASTRTLAVTAALCGAFALALGVAVAGQRSPTGFDAAFESGVDGTFGGAWVLTLLVAPTEPWAVLTVLAAVAGFGLARGRPEVVVLAVAGPALAVSVNTWVLKPAFGRYYDDHLAYPSGHTVSLVAAVTVVALLVRLRRARLLTVVCGTLLTGCAAVGMAGLDYHYVTDVAGGAATAVSLVSGFALLGNVSLRSGRRARRARRRRPEPAR